MIRLTLVLCVGLYLALVFLGEDHGQKRYGLMAAEQEGPVVAPAVQPEKVVFIPAQPVVDTQRVVAAVVAEPVVAEPVVAEPVVAEPVVAVEPVSADTAALPEPQIDGGQLFSVTGRAVNVRRGPGTEFSVVGTLILGEQVLVVQDPEAIAGWSRVRMEGDGVEGYVATRLLEPAN